MIEDNNSLTRYQILNVQSRNKHAVIKILDLSDNNNYCMKYLQVHCQEQIKFYQTTLSSINYAINTCKSKLTQTITYGLTPNHNQKQYIWMKSVYICDQTLDKLFMNSMRPKANQLSNQALSKFIHLLPFKILDLLIDTIEINTLIINQSNLYINPTDILVNHVSFAGCDLIFFEKSVALIEFRSIFNFINSNIFQEQPFKRIGHKQKLKNFAALLLTFILGRPIGLLQNQKLPQVVSFEVAKKYVKRSPQLYKKYLNIKHIRSKIAEHSKLWNIDLHRFFDQTLVQQKNLSWSEIYNFFSIKDEIQTTSHILLEEAVNDFWYKLSRAQKEYVYQKGYIRMSQGEDIQKVRLKIQESSILLIKAMRIKLASLKNGSIFDEMADRRNFDMLSLELMKGLIYILDFESEVIMQSLEMHRYTGDSFHLSVFKLLDSNQDEDLLNNNHLDCYSIKTIVVAGHDQQDIFEYLQQNLAQGGQEHVKPQIKREDYSKKNILDLAITSYKEKLKFQTKQEQKSIIIEHPRLKGLKQFENSFR